MADNTEVPGSALGVADRPSGQDGLRVGDLRALARALGAPPDHRHQAEVCRELVAAAGRAGNTEARAEGLHLLGYACTELGRFAEAREAYEQAVEAFHALGATDRELNARQGLVNALQMLGEPEAALGHAQQVIASGDWFRRCAGLIATGGIQEQLGRYEQALVHLAEVERLLDAAEATPAQAAYIRTYLHGNRSNIHLARGDLRSARDAAVQMVAAADLADLRGQRLEALINMGVSTMRTGDMVGAWRWLIQAQQAASLAADGLRESTANSSLAEWFTLAGMVDRAVHHGLKGVETARQTRAAFAEVYACLKLGAAYLESDEAESAAGYLATAQEVSRALKAPYSSITTAVLQGRLYLARGEALAAEATLLQAIGDADQISARQLAAEAQVWLAAAYVAERRFGEAASAASAALTRSEDSGDLHTQWQAQYHLAAALEGTSRRDEALYYYRSAVKTIEGMWWPLWSVGFAQVPSVKRSITNAYLGLLDAAETQGNRVEAERVLALSPWPFLRRMWEEHRAARCPTN
ncbi:MAG TPA: tetratricopeptide repeat protein [Armatimonadota bacterium]|nr:tetratricopeptide repeat protein [Armatimonadota bacterium]